MFDRNKFLSVSDKYPTLVFTHEGVAKWDLIGVS